MIALIGDCQECDVGQDAEMIALSFEMQLESPSKLSMMSENSVSVPSGGTSTCTSVPTLAAQR